MKIAILAALALGTAPAFAQVNLGNSSKDQATSDATKEDSSNKTSSSGTAATPQSSSDSSISAKSSDSSISAKSSDSTSVGDSGATADSSASSSGSKDRSVDQVKRDKQKGVARARAAKRNRDHSARSAEGVGSMGSANDATAGANPTKSSND